MTSAVDYERAKTLFGELLELAAPDRQTRLAELRGTDEALHRRVLELLRAVEETPLTWAIDARSTAADPAGVRGLVERLARDGTSRGATLDDSAGGGLIDAQIGSCILRRLIGTGGMGAVYEAHQVEPRRLVALKVIHPSLIGPAGRTRFLYEAGVLAHLEHPGIARIYEAGMHDTGSQSVPYFVMELVENAAPLITYANDRGLSIPERLRLFLQVCEAVQFAHQRGIIHRDLKPENVLVDRHGRARLIDFGIARATDADLSLVTLPSETGQLFGTIRYMSPEQHRGDVNAVDSRSDLYSLGVTLYELLSGEFPFDLAGSSVFDIPRLVRDSEPRRLGAVNRQCGGDLDAIVSKVMDKEAAQRYASVGEFAADIRRYLAGEAVEARRGLRWYVFRKSIRRHRVAVSITLALFVFLLGVAIALGVMYRQVQRRGEELASAAAAVDRARLSPLTSFEDDFTGGPLDANLYNIDDRGVFGVWRDDRLVLEKPDTWAGTSLVFVGSPRRALFGDFDLAVDWEVDRFDTRDGSRHWMGLGLVDAQTGVGRAGIRRIAGRSPAEGDPDILEAGHWLATYSGHLQPGERMDYTPTERKYRPTDATAGRFAIRRRGDTVDLRFRDGDVWQSLATAIVGTGPLFPVMVTGGVTRDSKHYAAFDNLSVAMAPPTPIRSERFTFDGDRLDERFTIDLGTGGLPYVAHGALVLDKAAGSLSGPTIYLDPNRSVVRGDFDISVRYELVDFPLPDPGETQIAMRLRRAADRTYFATVNLTADSTPRIEWHAQAADDSGPFRAIPATMGDGAFRITRRKTTVAISIWSEGWQELLTCELDNSDVIVGLYLYACHDTARRVIRFDDLRITASGEKGP